MSQDEKGEEAAITLRLLALCSGLNLGYFFAVFFGFLTSFLMSFLPLAAIRKSSL